MFFYSIFFFYFFSAKPRPVRHVLLPVPGLPQCQPAGLDLLVLLWNPLLILPLPGGGLPQDQGQGQVPHRGLSPVRLLLRLLLHRLRRLSGRQRDREPEQGPGRGGRLGNSGPRPRPDRGERGAGGTTPPEPGGNLTGQRPSVPPGSIVPT